MASDRAHGALVAGFRNLVNRNVRSTNSARVPRTRKPWTHLSASVGRRNEQLDSPIKRRPSAPMADRRPPKDMVHIDDLGSPRERPRERVGTDRGVGGSIRISLAACVDNGRAVDTQQRTPVGAPSGFYSTVLGRLTRRACPTSIGLRVRATGSSFGRMCGTSKTNRA